MLLCKEVSVNGKALSPSPCPLLCDNESQLTEVSKESKAQLCGTDVAATLFLEIPLCISLRFPTVPAAL